MCDGCRIVNGKLQEDSQDFNIGIMYLNMFWFDRQVSPELETGTENRKRQNQLSVSRSHHYLV